MVGERDERSKEMESYILKNHGPGVLREYRELFEEMKGTDPVDIFSIARERYYDKIMKNFDFGDEIIGDFDCADCCR